MLAFIDIYPSRDAGLEQQFIPYNELTNCHN